MMPRTLRRCSGLTQIPVIIPLRMSALALRSQLPAPRTNSEGQVTLVDRCNELLLHFFALDVVYTPRCWTAILRTAVCRS